MPLSQVSKDENHFPQWISPRPASVLPFLIQESDMWALLPICWSKIRFLYSNPLKLHSTHWSLYEEWLTNQIKNTNETNCQRRTVRKLNRQGIKVQLWWITSFREIEQWLLYWLRSDYKLNENVRRNQLKWIATSKTLYIALEWSQNLDKRPAWVLGLLEKTQNFPGLFNRHQQLPSVHDMWKI